MTITELRNHELTPAIAYIVGMAGTLFKEKKLAGVDYIVGSVNHNPLPSHVILDNPNTSNIYISETEILEHFTIVKDYLDQNNLNVKILSNSGDANGIGTISGKNGFSILIEKGYCTSTECKSILLDIITNIQESEDDEIKGYFIRGCFDGRSSIDWNSDRTIIRYLSLDIDRDYDKQKIVKEIANDLNIIVNLNQRAFDHTKNDQIRIKTDSFGTFLRRVGFFSVFRTRVFNTAYRNS